MPEMDGLILLKEICSWPDVKNLSFLMLTALPAKENVATAIKAGVSDFTSKPVQPGMVKKRVTKLITKLEGEKTTSQGFEDLTDL